VNGLESGKVSREPPDWLDDLNIRFHHGTLQIHYQRLMFFESGKSQLAVRYDIFFKSKPLGVALLQLGDNHCSFMIVLIFFIAFYAVKLLVSGVTALTFSLEAYIKNLKVTVAVALRHFIELKILHGGSVLHYV
jgi:hypothetical protein